MPLTDTDLIHALDTGRWNAYRNGQPIGSHELTIGPNSVNVTLHPKVLEVVPVGEYIDPYNPESVQCIELDCSHGLVLQPNRLYLAAVQESFDCSESLAIRVEEKISPLRPFNDFKVQTYFYPVIDGRSTVARIGLCVHQTAGRGDWGFSGAFTLELTVTHPLIVRAGDEIAQVYFEPLQGVPSQNYQGAYVHQQGPRAASLGKERFQR